MSSALLALSLAVCLGTVAHAGPIDVQLLTRKPVAEDRQSLSHLLAAITQAARKLGHRLDTQAISTNSHTIAWCPDGACTAVCRPQRYGVSLPPLRAALLNLPPPVRC